MCNIIIKLPAELLAGSKGDVVVTLSMQPEGNSPTVLIARGEQGMQQTADNGGMFLSFMNEVIAKLQLDGHVRTSETYRSTHNSFKRFLDGGDISFVNVTAALICSYEEWLRKEGLVPNSTSFYMRILRATYNRAVRQKLVFDRHPFADVYKGMARTVKRAVDLAVIRRIATLPLTDNYSIFARDMFMISFYMQGMAFVDMANLKRSDLRGHQLIYRRQKTGQHITIRWTDAMQAIVDRHPVPKGSQYMLPIIDPGRKASLRSQRRRCQGLVNSCLHDIGNMLQLHHKLTMYVARHSWASIAHEAGVPTTIISRGMGHTKEQTTNVYLKDIDCGEIAAANQRIINMVLGGE